MTIACLVPADPLPSPAGAAALVICVYYMHELGTILETVSRFEEDVGLRHGHLVVVDNSGQMETGSHPSDGRHIVVIRGSNEAAEFGAWQQGLIAVTAASATQGAAPIGIVTLLNDSFGRNWTIGWASRPLIRGMLRDAEAGYIGAWLDNFSDYRRLQFSRRLNSRVLFMSTRHMEAVCRSIESAIAREKSLRATGSPLFSARTVARLERWGATQGQRWGDSAFSGRLGRIYIEHRMLDAVPESLKLFRPRSMVGSVVYGLLRRVARERR